MFFDCLPMLLFYVVCIVAFEELIFAQGQGNQEMVNRGKIQYQLLKERSNLPQYGTCWKAAVEHLDEGCKQLSEDTQSDIALHITNCFLQMSGHETYNCELDKKPNLRAYCINSMSDRAFNVYTEFYTHTQNMCWFLRGQIWQEVIYENTWKVGKQLELTATNQEDLLRAQKESLELQERMIKHGKNLEQVLENLHATSNAHHDILMMLAKSINNLQSWVIGEVSWIDSVIFYITSVFVTFLLTSSQRTMSSRVPICTLLFLNLLFERIICSYITSDSLDINILSVYLKVYDFVWYSRYAFVCLGIITLLYKVIYHTNIHYKNNEILQKIYNQNAKLLNLFEGFSSKRKSTNGFLPINDFVNEKLRERSHISSERDSVCDSSQTNGSFSNYSISKYDRQKWRTENENNKSTNSFSDIKFSNSYNLRSTSRQPTPSC